MRNSQKEMCIFYGVCDESGWVEVYIEQNNYQKHFYCFTVMLSIDTVCKTSEHAKSFND